MLVASLVAVAVVAGAAALRDRRAVSSAGTETGPVHVHGLGVDPADGTLFVATHTGLWRVAPGEAKAARVGTSRRDLMGFTVAGPGHFLASGHPDSRREPPLLGLIESRDAGETWTSISLAGEADFHVLRLAGRRLYGYDASHGRLLVRRGLGRPWERLGTPATIGDLAVSPIDPFRLLATTDKGLFESADGGRSWRRVASVFGLLAWPLPHELLRVEENGDLLTSADRGRNWTPVGAIGGEPAAFAARSPTELYVALHDGTIKRSTDAGRSWEVHSTP
ncbi:MAG: exo-alpha-sialidase [Thermoleophilia bacterium]|nr:exo-alpha-sialidase [Thermoleophilia bacterium]